MAGTPEGFNAAEVREGLRLAMTVGLPPTVDDQPTFYMPRTSTSAGPVDDHGVPYSPDVVPIQSTLVRRTVTCAVEYLDAPGKLEAFGILVPAKIKITVLDEEYALIAGFEYVVIKGQRFFYRYTEPPVGLGTVTVYTIHCVAEDLL
jgi:hypothetical protein